MNKTRLIKLLNVLPIALLVSISQLVFAQGDTLSFSLAQAQNYALENSVDALNADLDKRISKKFSMEIISEGLPKISSEIGYQNNFELPVSIIPAGAFGNPEDLEVAFGTQHNMQADLRITQLIADGRYFIGLKANKAFIAVTDMQSDMTDVEIRKNVATAYYNALASVQYRDLLTDNILTVKDILAGTKLTYENGFIDELDLDRVTLSLMNLESRYNDAALRAEIAMNLLKFQMGLSLNEPIKLTDDLEALLVTGADSLSMDFDFTNRIEYQLLAKQYEIRGYDAQQIRAGNFPSLVAYFSYGVNAQREEFNFFDTSQPWFKNGQIGLSLKIPIFDGYKNGSQFKQKKLEQLQIGNNLENFEKQSRLEVMNAMANFKNAMESYVNQKKSLALAQKIFDKIIVMNREGLATSLELSQAEADLNETQGNYINAVYNLLVAKVELEKAYGNY